MENGFCGKSLVVWEKAVTLCWMMRSKLGCHRRHLYTIFLLPSAPLHCPTVNTTLTCLTQYHRNDRFAKPWRDQLEPWGRASSQAPKPFARQTVGKLHRGFLEVYYIKVASNPDAVKRDHHPGYCLEILARKVLHPPERQL